MLLNYDFLEFENDKKVRVIDDKLHVNILDFFGIGDEDDKIFLGDEISNIKDNPTEAYAAEVYAIEGAKLNRVYEKIMMAFIENSVIVKHSIKLLWINSQQIRAKRQ